MFSREGHLWALRSPVVLVQEVALMRTVRLEGPSVESLLHSAPALIAMHTVPRPKGLLCTQNSCALSGDGCQNSLLTQVAFLQTEFDKENQHFDFDVIIALAVYKSTAL